jgi:uncharacterized protein (TIGR03083 family)
MVSFPGESALRAERVAFVDTLRGLSEAEFESGPTLCDEWAPRDVLAHVVGIDDSVGTYVKAAGRVGTANARIVAAARSLSRAQLLDRAQQWAEKPAAHVRPVASLLLGDLGVHHSDVLRGLGHKHLEVPPATAAAVLREGFVLGAARAVRYRVVPDGRRAIGLPGRPVVRGTSEALGMWLAGRDSVADELQFGRHAGSRA